MKHNQQRKSDAHQLARLASRRSGVQVSSRTWKPDGTVTYLIRLRDGSFSGPLTYRAALRVLRKMPTDARREVRNRPPDKPIRLVSDMALLEETQSENGREESGR